MLVPDGDDGDRVCGGRDGGGGGGILPLPRYVLEDARPGEEDDQVITVAYADGSREDVSYAAARRLAAELERVSVKGILAPRFIAAARRTVGDLLASRPFDRPGGDMAVLERLTAGASAVARDRAAGQDGAEANGGRGTVEAQAAMLAARIDRLARWWQVNADTPGAYFNREVNQEAGIPDGGRPTASVVKLRLALEIARRKVAAFCDRAKVRLPRGWEDK